jgi:molecular chaperone GrpE
MWFSKKNKSMQEEQVLQTNSEEISVEIENAENNENAENTEIQVETDDSTTVAKLSAALEAAQKDLEEAKDQNLRLQADFTNFRKRKDKEMAETISYANEGLVKSLLPIMDDFQRTLTAIEKTDNLTAIKDGIMMVAKNMAHILSKIGLEPIQAIGEPFDTNLHEAITTIPAAEEQQGMVIDEVEKGYKLKEKVVRFSKVVIGE